MKTRRKSTVVEQEMFTVGPAPDPEPSNGTSTKQKERFQLSFDLNDDGSPDLSAMRGRTKEKVIQFFSDPRMAAAFGAKSPAVPEVQVFHPAMVGGLYSMLGAMEAMMAERFFKIPPPVAKQVFTYSQPEIDMLSGPTVRVLNKYAAEWMIRFQDEIALATMLVSITVGKVNAAITLAKAHRESNVVEIPKAPAEPEEKVN